MNREQIIQMAREACFVDYELDDGTDEAFDIRYVRFAKLVAEHSANVEREACAKVCEDNWHECGGQCANVIRYGKQA